MCSWFGCWVCSGFDMCLICAQGLVAGCAQGFLLWALCTVRVCVWKSRCVVSGVLAPLSKILPLLIFLLHGVTLGPSMSPSCWSFFVCASGALALSTESEGLQQDHAGLGSDYEKLPAVCSLSIILLCAVYLVLQFCMQCIQCNA